MTSQALWGRNFGAFKRPSPASQPARRRSPGRTKTHGLSDSPEYIAWQGMWKRCANKQDRDYPAYGGRGVQVCGEWKDFEIFISDMGMRPSPNHSIDRINNNGNYEPGNCRWTTTIEQANNRRTNHVVVYHDTKMSLSEAVRTAGSVVSIEVARWRIKQGWPIDLAVEKPARQTRRLIEDEDATRARTSLSPTPHAVVADAPFHAPGAP